MKLFILIFIFQLSFAFAQNSVLVKSENHGVPHAMTTIENVDGKKLTAGDLIVLEVTPFNQAQDAVPEILAKDEKLPKEWGVGRLLWVKPYDPETGKIRLGFTSYAPGTFEIKSMLFVKKDSGEKLFITDPKSVVFESVGGDKKKDDIYPPLSIELPMWMMVLLSALFLVATLLILRAVQRIRKKKKQLEWSMNSAEELNPIEEFEKQRQMIDSRSFLDRGQFKQHYFGLSEALKKFLGRAYHFDAQDKTTRELRESLREMEISPLVIERWLKISEEMDIIKFTDQVPNDEQAKELSKTLSALALSFWNASPEARELKELARKKNAI